MNHNFEIATVCLVMDLLCAKTEREICLFASNLFNILPLKTKKNNDFTF